MKLNFKKISAIATSTLLVGMTMATGIAANYPAPFVQNSAADVAIVYGANALVSDIAEAGSISTNLQSSMGAATSGSTSSSVEGGDSVLLERTSDKLNLRDNAATVFVTSVDEDDLANLLADGTYTDDDNTEYDYTQKITLGSNLVVEHFQDSDYNDNTPTIGLKMSDDEHVLNYTLDFTTHPAYNASTLETTNINLMGKSYYVLDVVGVGDSTTNQNKTTLLDSANTAIITQGETASIGGNDVSIAYISSTAVKLTVGTETTNSLGNGGTYKLSDGTYIGVKEILYDSKDTGISKVEVSIGTGKLEIANGQAIELNDVTINEIVGFNQQDASYKLDKIVLQWTMDDEGFIAPESDLLMPGFGSVKLSMGEFVFPSAEETTLTNSGSDVIELKTTIKDGEVTIPLLKADSTGSFASIGKDTSNRLVTSASPYVFFNETAGDKYVVASWNSTTEAESYYIKVEMTTENNVNKVKFTNQIDTSDSKTVNNGSDASFGSVSFTVNNVTRDGSKKWANISINSGGSFNTLYTEEGLKIYLPYFNSIANVTTAEGVISYNSSDFDGGWSRVVDQGIYNGSVGRLTGHGYTSFYVYAAEEDKDGNLAAGKKINMTLAESGTSDKVHVDAIGVNTGADSGFEIGSTDDYENYVKSDLATKTLYDTGSDQDSVVVTYAGDQAYANLFLTAPEATVTSTTTSGTAATQLGDVLVKDSEVSSVSDKNLIVVGGSCINSAAATLVGGAYCGAAFTDATGVGAGQFLIKGYATSTVTSKLALLVAGYDAADTIKAATYLRTQTVDTSKEYKGTSSTSATLVTTTTA